MQRLIPVLVVLVLVTAACGGDGDGEEVATLEDGSQQLAEDLEDAAGAGTDEDALLAFGACMRDNGVPEFPDPILLPDGTVDFGVGDRPGEGPLADVDQSVAEEAVAACVGELEGVAFGPGGFEFDLTEIQDRLVEFAQCMRDNGIDVPDPDLSDLTTGEGQGLNPFGDLDIEDPDVIAAVEECQDVFADLGLNPGG